MTTCNQKTILLVEDEASFAMTEKMSLEKYGYTVLIVNTGEKAIEFFHNNKAAVDIVLMDINLGAGIEGTEAAEIILEHHDLPLIFLSSHTEKEVVEKTEGITSYGYVVKSSNIAVLDASIKMAFKLFSEKLKVSEKHQALEQTNEELEQANEELVQTIERLEESQREIDEGIMALRKSENELRLLAEAMPQIVWITSPDGKSIFFNKQWVDYTGLSLDESYSDGWARTFHPDDQKSVLDAWQNAAKHGAGYSLECRLRRHDGEYKWWLIRGVPSFNDSGEIVKWFGTCTDINEIKQTEARLIEYQSKLNAALSSMTDAVFISNADGEFINFNEAFATFHKFRSKEECANKLSDYPSFLEVYLPNGELAPLDMWAVPRALRGETVTNAEYTLHHKVTGETWVGSYSFSPIRDNSGMIVGSVVVGRDISEIKQAEKRILELKRLYATLSQINQTIVRASDPEELYQSICDVSVQFGGFLLAWVGILDEASGEIRPVAANGLDLAHWPFPIVNIHQGEFRDGLSATAIRTSGIVTSEDIETDARTQAYHEQLSKYDYHSSASVPFSVKGKTAGVVNLVSREAGLFKAEEELTLLDEIGIDISFALDTMETVRIMRQWADAFENCAHGIVIGNPATNQILTCNAAFARDQGSPVEELICMPLLHLYHPQDRDKIKGYIEQSDRNGSVQFEASKVRKDGSVYEVQMDIVSVRDEKGNLLYRVATQQDITDRKQARQALTNLVERLNLATRSAQMGIWDWDIRNKRLVWDEQMFRLYGINQEGFPNLYESWLNGVHPDDRARCDEVSKKAINGEGVYDTEFRVLWPDGSVHWLKADGQVFRDENGEAVRMVGVNYDITGRKRAEGEIRLQLSEKEVFLKEAYHRIKNNISSIESLLLIQAHAAADVTVETALMEAVSRAQSIRVFYEKLLMARDFQDVSIKKYIVGLIDSLVKIFSESKKVTIENKITDFSLHPQKVIPVGIIFNELMTNIFKHAFAGRESGLIFISIDKTETHVTLTVRDNGIGFDEKNYSEKPPGFGLTIVKMLTEQLDGTYTIENDKGTRSILQFKI